MTITAVVRLEQCEDCPELTDNPPNAYGNTYCERHRHAD